ncbi:MAG: hypothetical protein ABIK65_07420 [Candidatus Eisenbacteria bacterium]
MEERKETEDARETAGERGTGKAGPGEGAPGAGDHTFSGDPYREDPGLWDKVRRGAVEGYHFAADKTDLYARVASRRMSILGLNRKIDHAYAELGEKTYNLLAADENAAVAADTAVRELVGRIRASEEEMTLKEAEIEEIRQEYRERAAAAKEEE